MIHNIQYPACTCSDIRPTRLSGKIRIRCIRTKIIPKSACQSLEEILGQTIKLRIRSYWHPTIVSCIWIIKKHWENEITMHFLFYFDVRSALCHSVFANLEFPSPTFFPHLLRPPPPMEHRIVVTTTELCSIRIPIIFPDPNMSSGFFKKLSSN